MEAFQNADDVVFLVLVVVVETTGSQNDDDVVADVVVVVVDDVPTFVAESDLCFASRNRILGSYLVCFHSMNRNSFLPRALESTIEKKRWS